MHLLQMLFWTPQVLYHRFITIHNNIFSQRKFLEIGDKTSEINEESQE